MNTDSRLTRPGSAPDILSLLQEEPCPAQQNGSGAAKAPERVQKTATANDSQTTPKPEDRPRIAKVEPPAEPVNFEQWRDVIAKNFPGLVRPAEVCASVIAQLLIKDVCNPFALALVDVPSSGKTITLNFFSDSEELVDSEKLAYTTDTFTAASFVSNATNATGKQLTQIDLLPRIRYRTLVVRELASLVNSSDDELKKAIGTLTRVLDGEGYQTDTGVHGRRGYKGDYLFMMLAGTTPIPPKLWKLLGNIGSRLFFMSLHSEQKEQSDLVAQIKGQDRRAKESACRDITNRFLRTLWAKHPEGIEWNRETELDEYVNVIAGCARLLARLRGAINVWNVGEDDEKLTHTIPTIELPDRLGCLFFNLARGHALICGRTQITRDDLWPVIELTFDSAPNTRAKVFRALIEHGGRLTTGQVIDALNCSQSTARREMEALAILKVVHKTDGVSHTETYIKLKDEFSWFTSAECRELLGLQGMAPRSAEQVIGEDDEQDVEI
jgi:hypothetical protein